MGGIGMLKGSRLPTVRPEMVAGQICDLYNL
jgi:hypothetical protein